MSDNAVKTELGIPAEVLDLERRARSVETYCGDLALPASDHHAGRSLALSNELNETAGSRRLVDLVGFSFGAVCLCQLARGPLS